MIRDAADLDVGAAAAAMEVETWQFVGAIVVLAEKILWCCKLLRVAAAAEV